MSCLPHQKYVEDLIQKFTVMGDPRQSHYNQNPSSSEKKYRLFSQ